MGKFGDYIFYILIAVSFIYSFIKKSKKKITEEEANKTTLPNGIPQQNIPELQVKPIPLFHPKPQPEIKTQKTFSESRQVAYETNPNPDVERMLVSSVITDEITGEKTFALNFTDVEEIKKGIVYAEIFNRKY